MYRLMAFILVGASAINSQSKHPTKPFTPPDEFYTRQPFVAKDAGCVKDYAKALSLSGIEQRKMLAELVKYECAESTSGLYRVLILESKTFDFGEQHVPMVRVNLGTNLDILPMAGVPRGIYMVGWIPRSAVFTRRELEAAKQKK